MSDLDLARRLIGGDEAAFEEFFSAYFPRLYRFALARLAGNEDAADEIAQRVLIRAIDRLHTYRGEAALLTWLCTFCRREIGRWLEQEGRHHDVPLLDEGPELRAVLDSVAVSGARDPEAELRRRELSELVQLTLDHLPGRYGDVLEWKYIQGLSVGEIALRLGLGYKAAESLLTRARAAFREGFSCTRGEWPAHGRPRAAEGT